MGSYETYSKRLRKRGRAGQPDVYQYDELPQQLRNQVIHIWNSALGPAVLRSVGRRTSGPLTVWNLVHDQIARELGVLYLGANPHADPKQQCERFLLDAETNEALDMIEFSFRAIQMLPQMLGASDLRTFTSQSAQEAIDELNHRFREHGVRYQFEGGEIVRVDSEYVHTEVVKPAIGLLAAGFDGPTEEFLEAHEHYRKGAYGDAIADALKAFESTMKAICDENGWTYNKGKDTAKDLIKVMLDNELVPRYMENHLAGLRNTLGAGLPTVRNKLGGHAQGKEPRKVPDYFAGYALHLAVTNIVFLVEAHKALNPD